MQTTLVSLRIDSIIIDKADTLAIAEDRSRNYIINKLLVDTIKSLEKKHGIIEVNTAQLEKFRRKKHSHNKLPATSGTNKS